MGNKYPDKLLENLPPSAAEFIKLIIKKMRYRKIVRAEVTAELAYHFEDELKDCKTEEEEKEKARKLIEEFGDPKLLAVLLRRAKKRCRPLLRTVIARSFQVIGVLLLCLILYIVWFFTGKPNITTNYFTQLNELVRPTVDESLNAAPYYQQAAELYEKNWDDAAESRDREPNDLTDEQRQMLETDMNVLLGSGYEKATDQQRKRVIRWLQKNEEIFDLLAAGSKKPYYWVSYKDDGDLASLIENVMPRLSTFRSLAQALRWRTGLAISEGRCGDALDDVRTCYRLGQHLTGEKILVEQLVGFAIEGLATYTFRETLSQCQIDSKTLVAIQADFEKMTVEQRFVPSLKAESLLFYDGIQRYFIDDPFGGHLDLRGLDGLSDFQLFLVKPLEQKGIFVLPHILFTHPDKEQTRETYDKFCEFWEKTAMKTPSQLRTEDIDFKKQAEEIVKGNLLLETSAPKFARTSEIGHRLKTSLESSLAIIAILRFKGDKGSYPENFGQLISEGYLKELPIDPFSDKPLVYRQEDDTFILYSYGKDFDDDGGQYSEWGQSRYGGDQVFWPVESTEQKEERRKKEKLKERQIREEKFGKPRAK